MSETAKARPILFSGPMVRAILEGRKTQTRRLGDRLMFIETKNPDRIIEQSSPDCGAKAEEWATCPFGRPGDRLWVRETWCRWYGGVLGGARGMECAEPSGTCGVTYLADMARKRVENTYWDRVRGHSVLAGFESSHAKWRPSIHMPLWASRLTLEVTEVRVQRLQEISEEDALAEGMHAQLMDPVPVMAPPAREQFRWLWDRINGERPGGPWSHNPWVWCISFRRLS